jgi:hypothetical protein
MTYTESLFALAVLAIPILGLFVVAALIEQVWHWLTNREDH